MSDIFISYARSTAAQAKQVGDVLIELGYTVWRDDELPAHKAYSDVIEAELQAAKAVVMIWSGDAAKSECVRSEADRARNDPRFVRLCARLGLVEYWIATGKWPDCADEVPYDFKAECDKASNVAKGAFGF